MEIRLGVFDWNGTLIDDSFANWTASNATLRAAGVPEISYERYRATMEFPLIHFYHRNGIDPDTYLANTERLNAAFMEVYQVEQKKAELRRGAVEMLDRLLDQGMTLMILSNHVQEHLEQQLAERHVHGKFKHICGNPVFRSTEITRTTKQGRLEKLLADHGYDARQAFIIGDSLEEPEIAHQLGMKAVSVTWGCFDPERLRQSHTNHLIDELSELCPLVSAKAA